MNNMNTNTFILESKMVHGDKYSYDRVVYNGSKSKVVITCKIHGDFQQQAHHHKKGSGCPRCNNTVRYSDSDFIVKSKKIHGDKYDYSKVDYISNRVKVNIICKIHGSFEQVPTSHFKGFGCSKCSSCCKLTTSDFIRRSIEIHGDIYDYSKVDYINNKNKVTITCKTHGDFLQRPSNHLRLQGCPDCERSKGEIRIKNILEENQIKYMSQFSFNDLKYLKKLHFDFCILNSDKTVKYLIEFNGEQHYFFKEKFHKSEESFLLSQYRDKLKIEYCNINNIPLHIIKYDEDIDSKLNEIISLY